MAWCSGLQKTWTNSQVVRSPYVYAADGLIHLRHDLAPHILTTIIPFDRNIEVGDFPSMLLHEAVVRKPSCRWIPPTDFPPWREPWDRPNNEAGDLNVVLKEAVPLFGMVRSQTQIREHGCKTEHSAHFEKFDETIPRVC